MRKFADKCEAKISITCGNIKIKIPTRELPGYGRLNPQWGKDGVSHGDHAQRTKEDAPDPEPGGVALRVPNFRAAIIGR